MATTLPIRTAVSKKDWIIDSGATDHLYSDLMQFLKLWKLRTPLPVHIGNGKAIRATGIGTVLLCTNSIEPLHLTAVLLVPDIRHNLISVNRLDEAYGITFRNSRCHISDKNGRVMVEAYCRDSLY